MAKAKTEVKVETTKKTRKITTPEERIAKLEADLEAAKAKAAKRADKVGSALRVRREALITRRNKLDDQINLITAQLGEIAGEPEDQPELPIEE